MSAEALKKQLNRAVDEQIASCLKAVWSSETPEVDTQAPLSERTIFARWSVLQMGSRWLGKPGWEDAYAAKLPGLTFKYLDQGLLASHIGFYSFFVGGAPCAL